MNYEAIAFNIDQILNYIIPNCDQQLRTIFDKIDEVWKERFAKYFSNDEVSTWLEAYSLINDGWTTKNKMISSSIYFQIKTIIACLVVRMVMKKRFFKTKIKKIYDSYYDVISKYSHRKLRKLLIVEGFRVVLKEYFCSQDFEIMLDTDPSLSPKKKIFRDLKLNLLSLIQGYN